ncbi:MAG: hypothetical protein DRI71_05635, partial [Bacteroidetes bacterium]
DNNSTTILDDFDSILENHKYANKGIYNLLATATNNLGDTTYEDLAITVSFKETSLAGIRETLFKTGQNEYSFLTINLHTYQEEDQLEKLNMVIDVIGQMDIDFITFQECAQHKSAELIDAIIREDNMAHLIVAGLDEKYSTSYKFSWDWAHYGWNVWEEGVSVLSKYPILENEARYVSSSTSKTNIESRKVIYSACQLPDGKQINMYSVHTHWRTSLTSEEQNNQIKNIQAMVDEKSTANSYSFVAGDFNVNPTSDYPWSEGYKTMIANGNYVDTYLLANDGANNKPAQSQHNTVLGDFPGRIDYIFMKSNADFEVVDSQIIFRADIVGKVSDHYGVITKVRLIN